MAAFIMESADLGAGHKESLAERLASGALPVPYALLCAIDVASTLRELHRKGLAHGEVGTGSIWLKESGALLQPRGSRSRSADARTDVAAFGAVLYQMFTGVRPPSGLRAPAFTPVTTARDLSDVRNDAIRLAEKCLDGSPDMKQVRIELRILGILTRGLQNKRRGLKVVEMPAPAVPEPRRLQVVETPAGVVPEPRFPQVAEETSTVAPEPQPLKVAEEIAATPAEPPHLAVADMPVAVAAESRWPVVSGARATLVAEPHLAEVELPAAAGLPAVDAPDLPTEAAPARPSGATIICPRCNGNAPLAPPRSLIDKLLNKFSHLRRCDLCGYRFVVLRFRRHKEF